MRKIALSGMKGRKKDTFLLGFIIFLSFLFVTVTIVLYSSSEKTKIDEKAKSYGLWENSFLNMESEFLKELKENKDIKDIGKTRIIGRSDNFGLIGSFDEEYLRLSNFELIEGRFPENDNEIMVELNQLKYFIQNPRVGDRVSVRITIPIVESNVSSGFGFDGKIYKTYESEVLSDIQVWVNTRHIIDENDEKDIQLNKSLKIGQEVILEKEMIISGIINTYTDAWSLEQSLLPNSYITEEASIKFMEECFYKSQLYDSSKHKIPINYLITSNLTPHEFYKIYKEKYSVLYINDLTYPAQEHNNEQILTYSILAFIYIITIFSVFQIYLTQLKRRMRKMALFKAIGAKNSQIRKLMIWETIYILAISLPLGVILGFVITKLITMGMSINSHNRLNLFINIRLLIYGILACVFSITVAIIIPLIRFQNVALTGEISISKNKARKSAREILGSKHTGVIKMNLKNITERHEQYNKGSNFITLGLYIVTLSILLFAIYLSFISFEEYINEVIISKKPSYQLLANYGYKTKDIPDLITEINKIENVKSTNVFKYIDKCELRYNGMKDDPI